MLTTTLLWAGSTFHAVTKSDEFVFVLDGYGENISQLTKIGHGLALQEAQLAEGGVPETPTSAGCLLFFYCSILYL
jgi:hypothetical protein